MDGKTVGKLCAGGNIWQDYEQKILQVRAWRNSHRIRTRQEVSTAAEASAEGVLGLSRVTQERVLGLGRLMLHLTLVTFVSSYLSHEWVCRVYDQSEDIQDQMQRAPHMRDVEGGGGANTSSFRPDQLYCLGVWAACDGTGQCDNVWTVVPGVNKIMVKWVQVLSTVTLMGYGCAALLDTASRVTLCVCLAYNRVVELILATSTVLHFLSLLYLTGEVKNEAVRVHRLRDVAGWGFGVTCTSLTLALISICVMALFRLTPPAYKHRRLWRLPADLRPRSYQASPAVLTRAISVNELSAPPSQFFTGISDRKLDQP